MQAENIRQLFMAGQIDALGISALYAQQRLSPLAFTTACLKAAENAPSVFISMTAARAREEAEASTLRWQACRPLSPLDGIPVAWKDLFDIQSSQTSAGSATRSNVPVAPQDAALVAQCSAAGMVTLGKTNLSEFAFSGLGLNPSFGTPAIRGSTSQLFAPGGSSSGAGRAIAEGLACIAFGTDTGGSIRIPAAFSGTIGYRASRQRYVTTGVYPLAHSLDTVGPLCRSVRDAIALDDILCGTQKMRFPAPHFRVDEALLAACQPAVRENACRRIAQLTAAGFRIDRAPLQAFNQALSWIADKGWPGGREAWLLHRELLASPDAALMDARVRERLLAASHQDPAVLETFLTQRKSWQQALAAELDGAVLITPTVAHTAPELAPLMQDDDLFAQTNLATLRLTMPGSLLDMPGIALPTGKDANGLYTSLLFSLPAGEDRRLLHAASTVAGTFTADHSVCA